MIATETSVRLDVAGKSVQGLDRDQNEDRFHISENLDVFVVADGMGGHSSGEVASSEAVRSISKRLQLLDKRCTSKDAETGICEALVETNARLRSLIRDTGEQHGMGTTCVVCVRCGDWFYVKSVGDSRAYQLSERLVQLTIDETLGQFLVNIGQLSPEELRKSPRRNILLHHLGSHDFKPTRELIRTQLAKGDRLLLCSDGLSDPLTDAELESLLGSSHSSATVVNRLIEAAREAGSMDDVTCIVISAE